MAIDREQAEEYVLAALEAGGDDPYATAVLRAVTASPERALLRRVLREGNAQVFAEPGGQPAWLGGSINLPVSPDEATLIAELLASAARAE